MKKSGVVLLFALLSFFTRAVDQIDHIEFHLTHSMRIPHAQVTIVFNAQGESIRCHVTSKIREGYKGDWKKTEIDTSFSFADSSFTKLTTAVAALDYETLKSQEREDGLDGYQCVLKYGNRQTLTSYDIWTPTVDTERRKLQQFLQTCHLLIRHAGLKPEEVM